MDVVVGDAIFAVSMAVSVSMFTTASTYRDTLRCHDNLEEIANLEMEYKLQSSTHLYTTTTSNLNSLVPCLPVCPDGGTYSVTISNGTITAQNGQTVPKGKIVITCSCARSWHYAEIDLP